MTESSSDTEITALINAWSAGDGPAEDELVRRTFPILRRIAARQLAAGKGTIQPTEVVHEAYLKLVGVRGGSWESRQQFFAFAARLMRQVLVDSARRKLSRKRAATTVSLDAVSLDAVSLDAVPLEAALSLPAGVVIDPEILSIDRALDKLAELDPRAARIVELRFFGGLTVDETAAAMDLGRTTVVDGWRHARAWLRAELRSD